ncbi:MAG: hypothetical protein QXQ02_01195 [Halobacteria archaeon]
MEEYTFDLQLGISIPNKKISIRSITRAIEEDELRRKLVDRIGEYLKSKRARG